MPADGKARGGRNVSSGSETAQCPQWLLGRSLCCIGVVVLIQNLILLRWGSNLASLCHGSIQEAKTQQAHQLSRNLAAPKQETLATKPAPVATTTLLAATQSQPATAAERGQGSWGPAKSEKFPELDLAPLKVELPETGAPPVTEPPVNPDASKRELQVADLSKEMSVTAAPLPTVTLPTLPEAEAILAHDEGGKGEGAKRFKPTTSLYTVSRDSIRLFGRKVPSSVVLTIGFGTVSRKKDYVLDTVGIMLGLRTEPGKPAVITAKERSMVVTVAHLADFNTAWVSRIAGQLEDQYKDLIDAGHFHGIHAPEEYYPRLDFCPPFCSYKDEPRRVRWRSKQNVDYAFLMYYAATLAPYYIQIEDDINFAQNWIFRIVNFIGREFPKGYQSPDGAPWRLIDFSQLGFIGKAFQSNDLTRLAQFLLLFYDQMPCDLLLGDFMLSMTQRKRIDYWRQHPSLFQHVGMFRSLAVGCFQPLQEKKFGKLIFDNPIATAVWNFTIVPTYEGKFAYISGGELGDRNDVCDFKASKAHKGKIKRCWFWSKSIKAGDHFTLIFEKAITMKAVFMEFGNHIHTKDLLKNGSFLVAENAGPQTPATANPGRLEFCGQFHKVNPIHGEEQCGHMVYWEEKASTPPTLPVKTVRCLRIQADLNQDAWTVLYQIQIRSQDSVR